MRPVVLIAVVGILSGCVTMTEAPPQLSSPTSPEILALASYEFGQSREPLRKVEEMVSNAMKNSDGGASVAAELAALLVVNATFDAQQFACRQLARVGTEANVPSIAPLLLNAKTADIARYALEPIPGRSVDQALINALDVAPKEAKAGIINSLGARGSSRAASTVARYQDHPDAVIAEAARSASKKIGG